jgi:hypothetical protein
MLVIVLALVSQTTRVQSLEMDDFGVASIEAKSYLLK